MVAPLDPDADVPARSVRVHASLPERERRSRSASAVSFLLHAIIIYLAIRLTAEVALPEHSPLGDVILMALGGGGGGGGQRGAAFDHSVTRPPPPKAVTPPVQPPPVPTPTVTPPPVQPPVTPPATAEPSAPGTVASAGTGTGTGGGTGSGVGSGTGSGRGPGSGSGSGGGNGDGRGGTIPENKFMTIPPITGTPKQLRNKSVEITFSIAADGRVISYLITPPIEDRGFAKKFDEVLRGYTFKPARDADGKPIAGTYNMTFTFGSK